MIRTDKVQRHLFSRVRARTQHKTEIQNMTIWWNLRFNENQSTIHRIEFPLAYKFCALLPIDIHISDWKSVYENGHWGDVLRLLPFICPIDTKTFKTIRFDCISIEWQSLLRPLSVRDQMSKQCRFERFLFLLSSANWTSTQNQQQWKIRRSREEGKNGEENFYFSQRRHFAEFVVLSVIHTGLAIFFYRDLKFIFSLLFLVC